MFEDLEDAVKTLHRHELVHGDLRAVNIMILDGGKHARIIDFDWAAKHKEGRYPAMINKAELKSEWDPKVKGNGLMMKEHDRYALDKVLKPTYGAK